MTAEHDVSNVGISAVCVGTDKGEEPLCGTTDNVNVHFNDIY